MYLHRMGDYELSDALDLLEDALNNAFGVKAVERPINEAIGLLTEEFYRREEFDLDYEQMWHEGHALFMEEQALSNPPAEYNVYSLRVGVPMLLFNLHTYRDAERALEYYRKKYPSGKLYPNVKGYYPNYSFYIGPA